MDVYSNEKAYNIVKSSKLAKVVDLVFLKIDLDPLK